ncbi:MAG: porin family protein [Rhodospirillaceae bacterium]|nr:porin family protein [Rhodospirillaceae bacterium]
MLRFAFLIGGFLALASTVSTPASAQNRLDYFSVSGGAFVPHDTDGTASGVPYTVSFDPSYALNLALGLDWGGGFRSEVELGYASAPINSLDFGSSSVGQGNDNAFFYTLTINAFYDVPLGMAVVPYVGGGLGVARSDVPRSRGTINGVSVTAPGHEDTSLAAHGEIGLAFPLSATAKFTAGYRYLTLFDGEGNNDDTTASYFKAGLRVNF